MISFLRQNNRDSHFSMNCIALFYCHDSFWYIYINVLQVYCPTRAWEKTGATCQRYVIGSTPKMDFNVLTTGTSHHICLYSPLKCMIHTVAAQNYWMYSFDLVDWSQKWEL